MNKLIIKGLVLAGTLFTVGSMTACSSKDTSESSSSISSSVNKDTNSETDFYTINKIAENGKVGNDILDSDKYNDLKVNETTLEEVIADYGLPTNVTGAKDGDTVLEASWIANEPGYSIGLSFKNGPTSSTSGEWILTDKYVVKTDEITAPEYQKP
ncbi:hypothetical protein OZX60_03100 [Streptococcaceae bacterium ESL0687]|nr:hypothetical protein OZX60_03100 [Streptococcaceae bacterium ESL0687]